MKSLGYDGMVDLYFDPPTCNMLDVELDKGKEGWHGAERCFEGIVLVDEKRC